MLRVCLLSFAILTCARANEAAPQAMDYDVVAPEGGTAKLRCLFRVQPPPKVTWMFEGHSINGNASRYRLMSDGALEINPLYRNDTGVYICVAKNDLGQATQEVQLIVNGENTIVTGELGRKLHVRCLAHGYQPPFVFWYRGSEKTMALYNDTEHEVRGNDLIFRNLSIGILGQYTCRAYNGVGKVASWGLIVRAFMPEGLLIKNEWLVPRGTVAPRARTLLPINATTTITITTTTTEAPRVLFTNLPSVPLALPQQESEVSAIYEGGAVTLRCLFHGNPPPKIVWRFGNLTINGNLGRYRLMSDGALMIVPLDRNDTGVYICVADNGLGVATQEIHLAVNDPVKMPAGIAGDESAVVTGELGSPLHLRCLAYGYPPPSVFWYRGYERVMVPYNNAVYEARGNVLLIRNLTLETLGQYTCQANNVENMPAVSWVVFVQAYMPEGLSIDNEFFVPRHTVEPRPTIQPPTTAETTTTASTSASAETPAEIVVPAKCTDYPVITNCDMIVRNKFCIYKYYSKFCCKSCVDAGQLDPQGAEFQADQPLKKK